MKLENCFLSHSSPRIIEQTAGQLDCRIVLRHVWVLGLCAE